jgi:phage terminase Nu1 subunit (DNA packaging protein)
LLFLSSGVAVTDTVMGPAGAGDAADDIRNLNEIARFFDASLPTVRRWIDDGCPVRQQGGNGVPYMLSVREVADWRAGVARAEAEERERKARIDDQLRLELGTDRLADVGEAAALSPVQRKAAIETEYARVRLAKEQRELIPYADVEAAAAIAVQQFRAALSNMAEDLGDELGLPDDVVLSLKARIAVRLADLADGLAKLGEG